MNSPAAGHGRANTGGGGERNNMGFLSILSFAHALVKERVREGDPAIDATLGNGHDTLFLCRLVGAHGHVYGTDIQAEAVEKTRERLGAEGLESSRYTLWQANHADLLEFLPLEAHGRVAAAMFNLGYLPGSDHATITSAETTIRALNAALSVLRPGGIVTAVVYPGHAGGDAEAAAVDAWAAALPQSEVQAMQYRFLNQRNAPPYVIAVEKRNNIHRLITVQEEKRMSVKPYPLQFRPEFKERVWGARELECFGFTLPEGNIGEAWMIGEHPNGTTEIVNGALAGKRLDEIRETYGADWFGTQGISPKTGKFPLLIKLLDCSDDLSVQVHPDDNYERLGPGELGKTEMWYVLDAKPDAKIIYGLRDGVDRKKLAQAIEENRILECLQEVPAHPGDTFYIPAGTVHALGAGVLVAEIQQNSDTTYRLYDYNRPGLDGKPRELHIEDSLNVIAYDGAGASRGTTELAGDNTWLTLASSPYFIVEKGRSSGEWALSTGSDSFQIIIACEGAGSIRWGSEEVSLKPGDCYLLPANLGTYTIAGGVTVLRSYVPSLNRS
jgi:mannose-6-phosphate isomerase